MGKRVLETGL